VTPDTAMQASRSRAEKTGQRLFAGKSIPATNETPPRCRTQLGHPLGRDQQVMRFRIENSADGGTQLQFAGSHDGRTRLDRSLASPNTHHGFKGKLRLDR
jgi:hypothetical protein